MHNVVTADFKENLKHGVMVCGINYGFSSEDERKERAEAKVELESKSFFSDASVNNTRFRNAIVKWLGLMGCPLVTEAGKETELERSFFQTNWLDTQTRSVTSDGKISVKTLVEESESFLQLLATRQPERILFFGRDLINALNDISIRDEVEHLLGPRPGNAENHTAQVPGYQGKQFIVQLQRWPKAEILCFPHPAGQGISDAYMAGFKSLVSSVMNR